MVVHCPNIRWIQAPTIHLTTAPRPETTLRERLPPVARRVHPLPLQAISDPKRLVDLKTSSASATIKAAWRLHKFNICDFLDEHATSAYVVVLRRPHT